MLLLWLQQAEQPFSAFGGLSLLPMLMIFALAWFVFFRPLQKQRKEADEMRTALKAGDDVVTTGGLYGTVKRLREDRVSLRIADGVEVEFAKSAIAAIISPKE